MRSNRHYTLALGLEAAQLESRTSKSSIVPIAVIITSYVVVNFNLNTTVGVSGDPDEFMYSI